MNVSNIAIVCLVAVCAVNPATAQRPSTHTYKSPDGSFTFKYTDPLILCRTGTPEAPRNWVPLDSCESQRPLCSTSDMLADAIACVAHPHSKEITTLSRAVFAVSVVPDAETEEACLKGLPASDDPKEPQTKLINGVRFKATAILDAAMMQTWNIRAYRAFHGGKCFELTTTTNDVSTGPYDLDQIRITTLEERLTIEGNLNRALDSFRFLK